MGCSWLHVQHLSAVIDGQRYPWWVTFMHHNFEYIQLLPVGSHISGYEFTHALNDACQPSTFIAELTRISKTRNKFEDFRKGIMDCRFMYGSSWQCREQQISEIMSDRSIIVRNYGFRCVIHIPLIRKSRKRLLTLITNVWTPVDGKKSNSNGIDAYKTDSY